MYHMQQHMHLYFIGPSNTFILVDNGHLFSVLFSVRPGETVLVHGASGGVGIAAVQIAKAHGMTVYGTASSKVYLLDFIVHL